MVILTENGYLLDQALTSGPRMSALRFKKRVFQVRFGDGKVKVIGNMEADEKNRKIHLYIKNFIFGRKKITIPLSQLMGWNQYALTSGKYCFDCPLYDSNGNEIKIDQDNLLVKLASKIDLLEKQLQETDATIASLRFELGQSRGTTDEAVELRISQIKKLSEAHQIGSAKKQPIPYYPGEMTPENLLKQEEQQ